MGRTIEKRTCWILKHLQCIGVFSKEQVSMLYQLNGRPRSLHSVERTLREWKDRLWLKKRHFGRDRFFEFTAHGTKCLSAFLGQPLRHQLPVSDMLLLHQIHLGDVYLAHLKTGHASDWVHGTVCYRKNGESKRLMPDAIIKTGKGGIAIELDRSTEPLRAKRSKTSILGKIESYNDVTQEKLVGARADIQELGYPLEGLIFVLSFRDPRNQRRANIDEICRKNLRNIKARIIYLENVFDGLKSALSGAPPAIDPDWGLMKELYREAAPLLQGRDESSRKMLERAKDAISRRAFL